MKNWWEKFKLFNMLGQFDHIWFILALLVGIGYTAAAGSLV